MLRALSESRGLTLAVCACVCVCVCVCVCLKDDGRAGRRLHVEESGGWLFPVKR